MVTSDKILRFHNFSRKSRLAQFGAFNLKTEKSMSCVNTAFGALSRRRREESEERIPCKGNQGTLYDDTRNSESFLKLQLHPYIY